MKKLMLSTALVAVTAMGSVAYADMHAQGAETGMAHGDMMVPAFRATDFTGKNLYVLDTEATRALGDERADSERDIWERTQLAWERADVFSGDRDSWENVGSIGDIVLSKDGSVRGVLVDVGGFLGLGARTVMVDMNELYFVAEEAGAEDISDFFVVATMSREALEALPEFEDDQLNFSFAAADRSSPAVQDGANMGADAQQDPVLDIASETEVDTATARTEVPEGYQVLPAQDRTADRLTGADVYGREGEQIATVDDLVIGATGEITHAVMDVGGFLGIGTHTIALEIDDLDILWNDADGNVRVQVTMTQEEMESLPEYQG